MSLGHFLAFAIVLATRPTRALVCYETEDHSQGLVERSSDEFKYCGIVAMSVAPGVAVFGVDFANEETEAYDNMFALKNEAGSWRYSVLSTCILEKYENLAEDGTQGHVFRCVCDTDRCNNAESFEQFFNSLE